MKKLLIMISCLSLFKPAYAVYNGDIILPNTKPAFPFVVAIYTSDKIADKYTDHDYAGCTGSIIDKNWVLTAGHCVINEKDHTIINPKQLLIGTGITAGKKPFADKQVSVDKIVPFFNPEEGYFTHDIALLHLSKPTTIIPVKLPASPQEIPGLKTNHISAVVLGYGHFTHRYYRDEDLRKGDILIQDDQAVDALIRKYLALPYMASAYMVSSYNDIQPYPNSDNWMPKFNPITMLGGTSPDGKRPLMADSGGPLLVNEPGDTANNDSYVQIGVTSTGLPPNDIGSDEQLFQAEPMLFVNLTDPDTLGFIKNTLTKSSHNGSRSSLETTCDTDDNNCIRVLLKNFPAGSSMSWEIAKHYNLHVETKHAFTWDSPQRNKRYQRLEKIDGEGPYYFPLFANIYYKDTKYPIDKEYTLTSEQINPDHVDSHKIYLSDDEEGLICQVLDGNGDQLRSSIIKWEDLPQGCPYTAEDIAQAGETFSSPILEKLLNQGYISLSNESLKNLVVTVTKINDVDIQNCMLSNDLITAPGIVGQLTITRQDDKHYTCEVSR